jgi:cation-transporting ATPase 13A2
MSVLAIISGLGFLGSIYNFIRFGLTWDIILLRALDLLTIAVPPALPATMAIGTRFAISRLEKAYIFCTSPPRVNICGKINIMVFDKTGTLTEEGLDVLGIRFTLPEKILIDTPQHSETGEFTKLRFSALYKTIDSIFPTPYVIPTDTLPSYFSNKVARLSPLTSVINLHSKQSVTSVSMANKAGPNAEPDFPYPLLVCAMATCHSIKVVRGELIGEPLDLKMFGYTGI